MKRSLACALARCWVQTALIAAVAWGAGVSARADDPSTIETRSLFVGGQDGYPCYRIPALVATKSGSLLAFCEGRRRSSDDSGSIDLLLKRSVDGGTTWSEQQTVWTDRDNTCGNPCPIVDQQTGAIWLLMTWNRGDDTEAQIMLGKGKDTRHVYVAQSDDDGQTWSAPRRITSDVKKADWTWYATGPGNGIQIVHGSHAGRLVAPCDHADGAGRYYSHVIYSDDHGCTWKLGGSSPRADTNECAVVELANRQLMLNMRNYDRVQTGRAVCYSSDGGNSWTDARVDQTLVEPICQASMIRVGAASGDGYLLFSNPASQKRERLTVRASADDGRTWSVLRQLHAGPSAYSSLAALPDGTAFCLYENGSKQPYEGISLTRFEVRLPLDHSTKSPPQP